MTNRPTLDQLVTFIYVADLEKSAEFYADILGLPLVLDQGACRIYQVSSTGFLGTCSSERATANKDAVIITLVAADVDGWFTYLQSRAVPVEKPPTHNQKYNIYHLFLRDPDGYLLEIQRFEDPDWPHPPIL